MNPTWATEDGSVQLYLGDCVTVVQHLEVGSIDCTITSPPYNQLEGIDPEKLSGIWAIKGATGKAQGAFTNNGYFDGVPESEYQVQQNYLFETIGGITSKSGSLFYNHQIRWRDGEILHPVQWFRPRGWRMRSEIVWDRGGGMMFNARMFCRFDERILWFVNGDGHKWNQSAVGYGTIWRIARAQDNEHPVAFPDEIPSRCIEAATDAGDLVLDCFMGSGTTGVACVRTGRRFIGIEREPKYFEIARKRIEAELNRAPLFEAAPKIQQSLI